MRHPGTACRAPRLAYISPCSVGGMVRYPVHDFVDVVLDHEVDPLLRRAIEFQVAGFGRSDTGARSGVPTVHVHPYRAFSPPEHERFVFNDMTSDCRTFLDEPFRRVATIRDGGGFHLYSDGDLLILLYLQLLLVERDVTLVHAAGLVDARGRALLIAGGGGAGKTALVGELVRSGAWRLLGDDLVCLSGDGRCYSFLRHLVLKPYHRSVFPDAFRGRSWLRRALLTTVGVTRSNAPLIGVTKSLLARLGLLEGVTRRIPSGSADQRAVPITTVFRRDQIAVSGELAQLIFLTRSDVRDPLWRPIDPAQLAQRLFAIMHHEMWTSLRSLLALGAVGLSDVPDYFERAAAIADRALEGRTVSHLTVPRTASPQVIVKALTADARIPA